MTAIYRTCHGIMFQWPFWQSSHWIYIYIYPFTSIFQSRTNIIKYMVYGQYFYRCCHIPSINLTIDRYFLCNELYNKIIIVFPVLLTGITDITLVYTTIWRCCHGRRCILIMMTSSNGNIFRFPGHLCGEFTGHGLTNNVIITVISMTLM